MPVQVNWEVEISALQDLSVTVPKSHDIAVDALWNEFNAAADRDGGALDQKILTAKIASETISAIEDLGALGWAIQQRESEGILRNYINSLPADVRSFYRDVSSSRVEMSSLLKLPDIGSSESTLGSNDRREFHEVLDQLQATLSAAASFYFERVEAYNKLKHGFPVIIRLDQLATGTPKTDWEQNVNILTGVTRDGRIRYVDLERSEGMLSSLSTTVEGTGRAWKALAWVMLVLADRGFILDPANA